MNIDNPTAFFARLGHDGLIGLGESYTAGEWTADNPAAVLTVFAHDPGRLIPRPLQRLRTAVLPSPPDSQIGTPANSRTNIEHHYDLSNALFRLFLDETMTYSSAMFTDNEISMGCIGWARLMLGQHRKIDRLLDLAGVGAGTQLLEIGTGWGELCIRAAARGATVRSVTLSRQQQSLARARVAAAGHARSVAIDLCDYRDIDGDYDAIVSVEMIEAVGFRHWPTYFKTLDRLLCPAGRVALQAITMPHERMLATQHGYSWIQKYIFPGGFLPSVEAIEETTVRHTGLRVQQHHSFGPHYAETLRLWRERFTARTAELDELGFDDQFQRMWRFYLAYSEAGFRSGYLDVGHFVLERS